MKIQKYFSIITVAALAVVLQVATQETYAVDREQACVRYKLENGTWSPLYRVRGKFTKISELEPLASGRRYNPLRYYFVIDWKKNDRTVLGLSSPSLPESFVPTKDQNRDRWEIRKGWTSCR